MPERFRMTYLLFTISDKTLYLEMSFLIHWSLFAPLTYVNVLHWIVGLYYHGFLVNEGIDLILVIQEFYPSTLSVLYNKDVHPISSIV